MSYFREFRWHWPQLLGASLGLAFGMALNQYVLNLFGPPMLKEFGWTKAQFALVGSLSLITLFLMPVAGWMSDRLGARKAAIVGFAVVPAVYFGYSLMTGSIYQFYALTLLKGVFGVLTAPMVFTRVVVERFDRARGLALSFLMSCPPIAGAVAAPIISSLIVSEGWRTGYQVLALMSACGGIAAILLMGSTKGDEAKVAPAPGPKMDGAQFRKMMRDPVFLLLLGGMFFCNVPQTLAYGQMSIMLMESGADMAFAAAMVSVYAGTVVIGRFASGYALDRVSPQVVALVALGLPAIGYLGIASDFDARWALTGAIALVGLAQGAETDVAAYLTSRKFGVANYGFVFGILMVASSAASGVGALLLSLTIKRTGNFDSFLVLAAAATVLGALCFFLTGRIGKTLAAGDPEFVAARADLLNSAD